MGVEVGVASGTPRGRLSSEFKAEVALVVLGQKTLNELASVFGIRPVQMAQPKHQIVYASAANFEYGRASRRERDQAQLGGFVRHYVPRSFNVLWPAVCLDFGRDHNARSPPRLHSVVLCQALARAACRTVTSSSMQPVPRTGSTSSRIRICRV